jgi:hypothetical protein
MEVLILAVVVAVTVHHLVQPPLVLVAQVVQA